MSRERSVFSSAFHSYARVLAFFVPAVASVGATAIAATIAVTTTADGIDAAASCEAVTLASLPGPNGVTSLREAVCAANNNAGADTITFSVNGTFALSGAANEDNGDSGDLDVKDSVSIQGNGAANTIFDGGGIERVFDVFPASPITFDLANLTVRNGDTRATAFKEGGAIYLHNNVTATITSCAIMNNFSGANGAIESRGGLTIADSVIMNNQTIPGSGSVNAGGLHNIGPLTVNNTTITNNTVNGEGGGLAINVAGGVTATITNSTISANTASVSGGGLGNGGGISTTGNQGVINLTNCTISGNHADANGGGAMFVTPGGGTATLTNVTISNNIADNDNDGSGVGGGLAQSAGVTLRNTIVAGNFNSTTSVRDDITGTVAAGSTFNLIGDGSGSTGLTNGVNGNQVGSAGSPINPQLGALADHGGPTQTHALLMGSPAIDKANNATAPSSDQRGAGRPADGDAVTGAVADIGAYELHVVASSAVSRKNHGGTNFDVGLQLSGLAGSEPRWGGPTNDYTFVVTFTGAVNVSGNPQAEVFTGTGMVGSGGVSNGGVVTVNGNTVVIPLTKVANRQAINVRLNSANGADVIIPMRILIGDVNGDVTVDSGDATVTRNASGHSANATNFRADVNVDGTINSGDSTIVRSRSGQFVP